MLIFTNWNYLLLLLSTSYGLKLRGYGFPNADTTVTFVCKRPNFAEEGVENNQEIAEVLAGLYKGY